MLLSGVSSSLLSEWATTGAALAVPSVSTQMPHLPVLDW